MRVKLIGVVVAMVVVIATYLAGYWPEHSRRVAAEARAESLERALTMAEARVRAGVLLGEVLTVRELVARLDYGQARDRSSALFDSIRQEAMATPNPALRDALNSALGKRDAVTAGLAKGEAATAAILHTVESDLRRALGYDVPPASAA